MLTLSLRRKALPVMLSGVLISPGRALQPVFSMPIPTTENKDDRKPPPCTFRMGGAGAVGRGALQGRRDSRGCGFGASPHPL